MAILLNLIYLALLLLASPLILWRRLAHGRYRRGWSEKLFGRMPVFHKSNASTRPQETLWFHAVSVGELQVIRPVVEMAHRERPEVRIVVTTSTDSGYDLACKLYAQHTVCFAPLDFSWAVRTAIDRIDPTLLVLAELELWPNWIRTAAARKIPIAVINARLSARSLQGYRRIAWLIGPVVRQLAWIGAQSATYRSRFIALGCDPERVIETGNIKFDGASPDRQHPEVQLRRALLSLRDGDANREVIWLCGSTQAPEEQICLDVFCSLVKRYPQLRLIVVPRHAERFDEVARLVAGTDLSWLRRSQLNDRACDPNWQACDPNWQACDPNWQIFLADSVGELRWWWGLADLGFVGGSFGSRGGQNMIEPCAYGVATCFGPNTRNFSDVVQLLLESRAAVQLPDASQLQAWLARMLDQPEERETLANRARSVTDQHRGAVARTWKTLARMLDQAKETR